MEIPRRVASAVIAAGIGLSNSGPLMKVDEAFAQEVFEPQRVYLPFVGANGSFAQQGGESVPPEPTASTEANAQCVEKGIQEYPNTVIESTTFYDHKGRIYRSIIEYPNFPTLIGEIVYVEDGRVDRPIPQKPTDFEGRFYVHMHHYKNGVVARKDYYVEDGKPAYSEFFVYNDAGLLVAVKRTDGAIQTPVPFREYAYDGEGRIVKMREHYSEPGFWGKETEFVRHEKTGVVETRIVRLLGEEGDVLDSQTTTYIHNSYGQVVVERSYSNTGSAEETVVFSYNNRGWLQQARSDRAYTQETYIFLYSYDEIGRLTRLTVVYPNGETAQTTISRENCKTP